MGARVSRTDYEWVYSDQPHATRRRIILKKYPQIKKLMRVDPWFKWIVTAMVLTNFITYYLLRNVTSFWLLLVLSYCFSGVINHSLTLAIHEIGHHQAFGNSYPVANKLFGIFANLPIGVPMSVSFKKYHVDHHRYQGVDVLDTDVPSRFEAAVFTTTSTKILWIILQPLFYALRPVLTQPKPPCILEIVNVVVQLTFDYIIGVTLGWHVVAYMIGSSLICMGLHPVAGHFISEHYIMFEQHQYSVKAKQSGVYLNDGEFLIPDTCSYYGPLNWITYNVGYHVEHHDFPSIPCTLLPQVRRIAPEFYDTLCSHTSWTKVLWQYIIDPKMGPFARVKRPHRSIYGRMNHSVVHDSDNNLNQSKELTEQ